MVGYELSASIIYKYGILSFDFVIDVWNKKIRLKVNNINSIYLIINKFMNQFGIFMKMSSNIFCLSKD